MARHLRVEFPGAIYHVTCRMVGDRKSEISFLFKDDADHERFLDGLAERVGQFNIRLYLFVCMTNHFHLVFETPEANCSKFMQTLLTAYTVYYNLRHARHGHLLDGRFKAKLVEGDDYLLALSRYVHLNPVQIGPMKNNSIAERISALRSWLWSSYPSYIGQRKPFDFVAYSPVLAQMGGRQHEWPRRYRAFVESGLAKSDEEFKAILKASPLSIGGNQFRARIEALYEKRIQQYARPEDAAFRCIMKPLSSEEVLTILANIFGIEIGEFKRRRYASPLRAVAARCLIRFAGLNQREVADLLNIGIGSAVSKQLAALPNKLSKDQLLRRRVTQAEARLAKVKKDRSYKRPDA